MIDLSRYRVIDLSLELIAGEQRIDGHYLHEEPAAGLPVKLRQATAIWTRATALEEVDATAEETTP